MVGGPITSRTPCTTDMGPAGMSRDRKIRIDATADKLGPRRGFLLIVSVAWLLLCSVALAACAVSIAQPFKWSETLDYYVVPTQTIGPELTRYRSIEFANGVVHLKFAGLGKLTPGKSVKSVVSGSTMIFAPPRTFLGFCCSFPDSPLLAWQIYDFGMPVWPLAVLAILLPLRPYLRYKRAKWAGACDNCGYDLYGNSSGVCPECGRKIAILNP